MFVPSTEAWSEPAKYLEPSVSAISFLYDLSFENRWRKVTYHGALFTPVEQCSMFGTINSLYQLSKSTPRGKSVSST